MPGRTPADLRPSTWLELLDLLFADAWNEEIGRFRSPFAFRGQPVASDDLSSGLVRLAAGRDAAALEQHLLRNFRKYALAEVGDANIWEWLALAQHRGLPTRLLDWTYSPFVALHFVTASLAHMRDDGAVWAIDFVAANRTLPPRIRRMLTREGSDTATVDMLGAFEHLGDFDRLSRRPFVLFLEPPSIDPRITNQFALFSLMPNPSARLHSWLASAPHLARRIVVPASLKWEIRDKLDQLNISERVLFPGLDGLARWLTRYYWPRPSDGHRSSRTGRRDVRGVRTDVDVAADRGRRVSGPRRRMR